MINANHGLVKHQTSVLLPRGCKSDTAKPKINYYSILYLTFFKLEASPIQNANSLFSLNNITYEQAKAGSSSKAGTSSSIIIHLSTTEFAFHRAQSHTGSSWQKLHTKPSQQDLFQFRKVNNQDVKGFHK